MSKLVPQPHGGAINQNEKGDPVSPDVGRPRRTVRVILDEWEKQGVGRVSKEDVAQAYESVVNLPEDEMKEVMNDKKAPMLVRIVAKALLDRRGFDILETMLNRSQGKPKQDEESKTPIPINVNVTFENGRSITGETTTSLPTQTV